MTTYSHMAWFAKQTHNVKLLEGDEAALAAIRQATRDWYRATDISDDAPVFVNRGIYVKATAESLEANERSYEIPVEARDYVTMRPFPQDPVAAMPTTSDPAASKEPTRREEMLAASKQAEGDESGIADAMNRTRLYHEVPEELFPTKDGELRWFKNGLHVVGPGDDPSVFQTPMDRVADLVVPREFPKLPWIAAPKVAR
jgi:hypothetical protein